jgi:hypothetical protein
LNAPTPLPIKRVVLPAHNTRFVLILLLGPNPRWFELVLQAGIFNARAHYSDEGWTILLKINNAWNLGGRGLKRSSFLCAGNLSLISSTLLKNSARIPGKRHRQ